MERWLIEVLARIRKAASLTDVKAALADIAAMLDCGRFAYAVKLPNGFTRSAYLIVSNYSEEWLARYARRGYVKIDPVVQHCCRSQDPYAWEAFRGQRDAAIRGFAAEAHDFGLSNGLSVGMPRFDGEVGLISMAGNARLTATSETSMYANLCLNALQPYIHERVRQVAQPAELEDRDVQLSAREKDCLLWTAEGKTAAEIAAILNIAEATVVFHLRNAAKKLDVVNRSQAVAKAVLLGLILPQYSSSRIPTYHF